MNQISKKYDLEAMKNVDVRTVDKDSLVDITSVKIDQSLPHEERLQNFIEQIGNPYCFRCGKVVVKNSFTEGGISLEEALAKNFLAMQS